MTRQEYYPIKWENLFGPQPVTRIMSELNETSNVMTGTDSPSPASNAEQVGGAHYKKLKTQPWDYVIDNELDYFQGSIIKYVTRWRDKNGVEDLLKAKHFLDKYIETMEKKNVG